MHVKSGVETVVVDISGTTGRSDSVFGKKITNACTAVKSYVKSRRDAIGHPTKETANSALTITSFSLGISATISMVYALIATEGGDKTFTAEQKQIFFILLLSCFPVITLLLDVVCYVKDRR